MSGRLALNQDTVEVLVKKLDEDTRKIITNDIITKTQEEMRLLQIKAGRTLTTFDTKEIRAAILLDYVVREVKGTRLEHKCLLKALGINEKNKLKFMALHDTVGNYRAPEPAAPPKGASNQGNRPSNYTLRQHAPQIPVENSIPRLAIRLSSMIPDPNGSSIQAQVLFKEMQNFVRSLEMPRRSDQLKDIERFWSSYEAACLYHVVAKTQTKKLSRMSKPKHNKQGGSGLEEMNGSLEIEDILKACPNFSQRDFQQVCKHVAGLVTEMEEAKEKAVQKKRSEREKSAKKVEGKKRDRNSSCSRDLMVFDNPNKSRKQIRNSEAVPASEKYPADKPSQSERKRPKDSIDISIPSLHEWRDQVLNEACAAARKTLSAAGKTEEEMNEATLIATAADAVLRQYGLLT